MVNVAHLRHLLEEVEGEDAEVIVELPGTFRPVAGISLRDTAAHGEQLVALADL